MVYLVNFSEDPDMYSCSFTLWKLYPVVNETVTDDDVVSSNLNPLYRFEMVIDL